MPAQPLRAGVIGLGVGGAHAEGYLRAPGAELVALCDTNEARLRERGQKYDVPAEGLYTSYPDMLERAQLDIVSICLPNALHAEASIRALEAGCHVLCEKPLAPSVDEVRDMIKAARLNDRRLMVAYNHRYRADMAWVRRMHAEKRLGTIYRVDAWWRRETGIPGWGTFSQQQFSGGGALIDLGVHVLDLALWMLDFPAVHSVSGMVRASFGPRGQKAWGGPPAVFDVDDWGEGYIRLAGGTTIHLQASWAEHRTPGDDLIRLEFQGTEGTAVVNIPNYTKTDTLRFYTEMAGAPVTVIPVVRWSAPAGHEALIADCLACLASDVPSPTDAAQGLIAVRILEAIYHSAQTGREVSFETMPDMMV
jgi:predicted dehydrogenase